MGDLRDEFRLHPWLGEVGQGLVLHTTEVCPVGPTGSGGGRREGWSSWTSRTSREDPVWHRFPDLVSPRDKQRYPCFCRSQAGGVCPSQLSPLCKRSTMKEDDDGDGFWKPGVGSRSPSPPRSGLRRLLGWYANHNTCRRSGLTSTGLGSSGPSDSFEG